MLNLSILDGWGDCTLAKNHHPAKTATITGERPETKVKEEAPNEVMEDTSGTESNSPALTRLRCVTKGTRGTILGRTTSAGTPMQKIHV